MNMIDMESYTDNGGNGRTMENIFTAPGVTLEQCGAIAQARYFKYFGVEYGMSLPLPLTNTAHLHVQDHSRHLIGLLDPRL